MSINIMVRVRPSLNINYLNCEGNILHVREVKKDILSNDKIIRKQFVFDKVFDTSVNNLQIYEHFCKDMISNLIKGNNSIFYVFGQTGTGKTHTIFGSDFDNGLLEIILSYIFSKNIEINLNCIQIYNNKCYDLLNNNVYMNEMESNDEIKFINLKTIDIDENNYKDVIELIKKRRTNGKSSKNDTSSRSHIITQINFGQNYIKILDIAGNERARSALFLNTINKKENCEINKNIFALKECIRSIKNKANHVPYRRCKLTKLLKDSFQQKVKTYILGTVSCERSNISDTVNTLNYITDLKKVKKKLVPLKNGDQLRDKLINLIDKKFKLDFEFIKEHNTILESLKVNKKIDSKKFKYIINDEINVLNDIKKINI